MDAAARARERALTLEGDRAERVELLHAARRRGDEAAQRALELAAYLGEPASRAALGLPPEVRCGRLPGCVIDLDVGRGEVSGQHDPRCPLPSLFRLDRYLLDLCRHGPEVPLRAALAVARQALEWWDGLQGWEAISVGAGEVRLEHRHYLRLSDESRHDRPRRLLDAVERWVLEPTLARRRAIARCRAIAPDERPFAHLAELPERGDAAACATVAACARFLPEERLVRRAIRDALVPWTLGERDPLRAIARLRERDAG
ncbi:MAG: hypothetical protein AB7N76_10715 [Planctomycetota bacterium]